MALVNPFSGPPSNPDNPAVEISSHEALWKAVTKLRIGQARLEERTRFNWLLGIALMGGQVAIFTRLIW